MSAELTEVSSQDWQEARRRLEVIQSLAAATGRTRCSVEEAAELLRLSVTHAYRLLKRYESDPRLTSLLPARRGRKQGHNRLATMVEQIIQSAIEEVYLTRQKPRVSVLAKDARLLETATVRSRDRSRHPGRSLWSRSITLWSM